jgi:hypothetical protein
VIDRPITSGYQIDAMRIDYLDTVAAAGLTRVMLSA